jgi:hypothetical protein
MVGKSTKKRKTGRKSTVERREFLVHLEPRLIKSLKLAALEAEPAVTASSLLETAVREWIDRGMPPGENSGIDGGEKRQFLSKIDVRLIKSVKLAAFDRHVKGSALVAQAVAAWLGRNRQDRNSAPGTGR